MITYQDPNRNSLLARLNLPRIYTYDRDFRGVEPCDRGNQERALASLENCGKIFGAAGIPFLLSGGLASAAVCGEVYRSHSDLDIVVDIDQLPKMLCLQNYQLVRQRFSTHLGSSKELAVGELFTPDRYNVTSQDKVRLLLLNPGKLFRFIDVHFYRVTGNYVTCSFEHPISKDVLIWDKQFMCKDQPVGVVHPIYQLLLKDFGAHRDKDRLDCEKIGARYPEELKIARTLYER